MLRPPTLPGPTSPASHGRALALHTEPPSSKSPQGMTRFHTDSATSNTIYIDNGAIMTTSTDRILRIEFPEPGEQRIRKIVSRSRTVMTTISDSAKTGGQVHGEGYEPIVFDDLEADPLVKTYRDQPCRIFYLLGGVEQTHIPDALVVPYVGLNKLIEIKLKRYVTREVVARTELMTWGLPA